MMERLTEKTVGCFEYALKNHTPIPGEFGTYEAFFDYSMAVKKLGKYEDAEEAKAQQPMTNGDRIRSMTDEELRDFLDKFRVETYTEPFGKKFCKCCPTVGTTEYKECEFVDGVCPHGDSLMWWLEQKVVT